MFSLAISFHAHTLYIRQYPFSWGSGHACILLQKAAILLLAWFAHKLERGLPSRITRLVDLIISRAAKGLGKRAAFVMRTTAGPGTGCGGLSFSVVYDITGLVE